MFYAHVVKVHARLHMPVLERLKSCHASLHRATWAPRRTCTTQSSHHRWFPSSSLFLNPILPVANAQMMSEEIGRSTRVKLSSQHCRGMPFGNSVVPTPLLLLRPPFFMHRPFHCSHFTDTELFLALQTIARKRWPLTSVDLHPMSYEAAAIRPSLIDWLHNGPLQRYM